MKYKNKNGIMAIMKRNRYSYNMLSTTTTTKTTIPSSSNPKVYFNPITPTCPALEWASQPNNKRVALECLNVPRRQPMYMYAERLDAMGVHYTDWDDYLHHRNWTVANQLTTAVEYEYAHALASHVMSAPMTILSVLHQLLLGADRMEFKKENRTKVRICCIGARSEASLPFQYWQEMIDLIHAQRILSRSEPDVTGKTTKEKTDVLDIHLDFIGPEMNVQPKVELEHHPTLQPQQRQQHAEFDFVGDFTPIQTRCTIRWRYKGYFHKYYHQIGATDDAGLYERNYDSYILFNPGIGHPHLMESWAPTLRILFDQYYRTSSSNGCTIVMTAHSKRDAHRDSKCLQEKYLKNTTTVVSPKQPKKMKTVDVVNRDNDDPTTTTTTSTSTMNDPYYYIENPFASRIYYHDPIVIVDKVSNERQQQGTNIVRPNHYLAVFPRLDDNNNNNKGS